MDKWADYLISGIWKTNGHISHVQIHKDNGDDVSTGVKKTEAEVIALLDSKHTVMTIIWNYKSGGWNKGMKVQPVTIDKVRYLRTHQDDNVTDNLSHMPHFSHMVP